MLQQRTVAKSSQDFDYRLGAFAGVARDITGCKGVILAVQDPDSGLVSIKGLDLSATRAAKLVHDKWEKLAPDFDPTQITYPSDVNHCFTKARETGEFTGCSFEEVFQGILPSGVISAYQKAWPRNQATICTMKASTQTLAGFQDIGYLIFVGQGKTSPRQGKLMRACARQVAHFVEDLLFIEKEHRKTEELAMVAAINQSITSTLETQDVLKRIAESAQVLFKADGVSLWITGEDGALELATAAGIAWEERGNGKRFLLGEGIPGLAAQDKKPMVVNDTQKDPRINEEGRRILKSANINASLVVPMIWEDQTVGAFGAEFVAPRDFPEDMVELAQVLASHGAIAIHNAQLHERAQRAATRDDLTGTFNHTEFHSRLRAELSRAKRIGSAFSIIMLDIDNFKTVNDTYGHLAGDKVLRELGALLWEIVRGYDIVARYGGDEFALILPGANRKEGEQVAKRIVGVIADHSFSMNTGHNHRLAVSTGIATYPIDGEDPSALILNADKGLYISKGRPLDPLTSPSPPPSPS